MADLKDNPPTAARVKRWKIVGGDAVGLPNPFGGTYEVNNKQLESPHVIEFIKMIEAKTGHEILGKLIVQE